MRSGIERAIIDIAIMVLFALALGAALFALLGAERMTALLATFLV